ncbi:MAG: PEP-CTERM sorting domain-containing protein [Planctomycetota bacterium]
MFKRSISILIVVLTGFVMTSEAQAQFGNLQRLLFRATEYSGDRDFLSTPQGGPLFDNNLFEQRIEQNRSGDGFSYDSFRFFGPDSFDNPNTIDLGPLKVQLGRDPTILGSTQPVGIQNHIGFTTAIIPEVTFKTRTGQRAFDVFSGQTNFVAAPVNYNVIFDTGVQNFNWNGNLLVDTNGKVNAMGFYDFDMRLTNVGNATAEGVLLQNEQITDFDTGPIHVTGNLLFDAIGSALQSTGNTLGAAPFSILSSAPPKDKKADELMARINSGEKIADADMQYLVQQMLITAFKNDPLGFLTNGLPDSVPGFEGLNLKTYDGSPTSIDPAYVSAAEAAGAGGQTASAVSGLPDPNGTTVPEPGTLILLAAAAGSMRLLRAVERRLR